MKASERFGRAPSKFLGGVEWGERDHLLVFAYQLYLDLKCPVCGGSMAECRNEANANLFEAEDTTCHRQAAVDARTRVKDFKPEPGQLFYAVPSDDELVTGSGLVFTQLASADAGGDEPAEGH